jgi:hypothetical protein
VGFDVTRQRAARNRVFFDHFGIWYWSCEVEFRWDKISLVFVNAEHSMNAKKRRKIYGVRREFRRSRGWTRWFHEGLLEADPSGCVRLRTVLWGQK